MQEPPLIAGKSLKKNTDYWLTADFWLGGRCLHNTRVRLKGYREKFACVVDDDGIEYAISPDAKIFTEEDKR